MIERVARAIKAELGRQMNAKPLPGPGNPDDWSASGGEINLEEVARAAISAMREPTEAMDAAGHAAWARWESDDDKHDDETLHKTACQVVFTAMIDEALSQSGDPPSA